MTATKSAALAALLLCVTGAAQAQNAASASVQVDPAAVNALAASIQSGLAALPANASTADMEAAIAFAVSQSGQPPAVVTAALGKVSGLSPKASAALRVYARKYAANGGQTGTGALAADRAITSASLGAGPSGGGGGTSDYSRRP